VQAPSPAASDAAARAADSIERTDSPAPADGAFNISAEETVRRLRAKGQPIRLFGEGDKERRLRLRALELIAEKDGERHGGQNDFRRALAEVESRERELKATEAGDTGDKGRKRDTPASAGTEVLDLGLLKTDRNKLYPIIYHALKRILKEWEEAMDARPDSVKQTTQGKLAAATQNQSADYLKPLFKILRSRVSFSFESLTLHGSDARVEHAGRCFGPYFGDCSPHSKAPVPTCQRCILASLHW
jgi:pre-mRNA-splicing factor 18